MEDKLSFIRDFFKRKNLFEIPEDLDTKEKVELIFNILNEKDSQVDDNGLYEHYMGLYLTVKDNGIDFSYDFNIVQHPEIVEKIEQIKNLYLKAIEKGNKKSLANYIDFLNNLNEDVLNCSKIMEKSEDSYALCRYAYFLEKNNIEMSKFYYLRAIEQGCNIAMNNYAIIMDREYRKNLLIKDFNESEKYYLKAIEKDNDISMVNYGNLLEFKYRNENINDSSQIKNLYLKAIEKGNTNAIKQYLKLLETPKDLSEIKRCRLLLIDKGDDHSLLLVGDIFKNEGNVKEAMKYYYKHYEKTKFSTGLNRIRDMIGEKEIILNYVKQIEQIEEQEKKIEELQNFKNAVNDMGPMNALVLGYL